MNKPIAFVIPWYGEELKGGAEQFAWQFSHRLASRGHQVEILTTCCASFLEDWNHNHLEPGEEKIEENLLVRRFEVRQRDSHAFHRANTDLLGHPVSWLRKRKYFPPLEGGSNFVGENIRSDSLNSYITEHVDDYRSYVFIPYMYGTTFDCLPEVADRAYLHPCLHDEAYAYLPQVNDLFRICRGILYNSRGEQSLAESLYGPGIHDKGFVVGGGVEIDTAENSMVTNSVAGRDLQAQRFILSLGRRDNTKNTDLLVNAFRAFKSRHPGQDISLYLAGPGSNNYTDENNDILDFGLVTEAEKIALLKNCSALMQPSANESYSRTLMEAWLHGKPTAVHQDCDATSDPVEQSCGGWIARELESWVSVIGSVCETSQEELDAMGSRGRLYAQEYASWDKALDRYECALELSSARQPPSPDRRLNRVFQLTAGLTHGDAISNQALYIRDCLRDAGYESEILVESLDPACEDQAAVYRDGMLDNVDAIIYHHSIGSSLSRACSGFNGPKALIYHNITPPEYFAPYDEHVASLLAAGREEISRIVGDYTTLWGDSQYNVNELLALGGSTEGKVLPIAVSPGLWVDAPCQEILEGLSDGKRNILFVGRVSPNKCQIDLVEAFGHYRVLDPDSRLILVGGYDPAEKYYQNLRSVIVSLGLEEHVLITGKVDQSRLHAFYRSAHLFWSMSEHEGFGVPLVESMWFELPVMAYKSSAVAETLDEGGITFDDKTDLNHLAFLASAMLGDEALRQDIIAGQRSRRLDFHPGQILAPLRKLVSDLEESAVRGENSRAV